MKISYCTTCHNRLWQLKQTLEHNLAFTKEGEVELCILAYNDLEVEPYLKENYPEYIVDGRLKVKSIQSRIPFSCGHVKNFSHDMGSGDILFNLDADNFICNAHEHLLKLKPYQVFKGKIRTMSGESGRIGIYRKLYKQIGGYDRNAGTNDDGEFISRCLRAGARLVQDYCRIPPIPNEQPEDNIYKESNLDESK